MVIVRLLAVAAIATSATAAPPIVSGQAQPVPRDLTLTPAMRDDAGKLARLGVGSTVLRVYNAKKQS